MWKKILQCLRKIKIGIIKMNNKNEIWKDVAGFEGVYVVSNLGNVARIRGNSLRYLKACCAGGRTGREYLYVNFSYNGVHKTVSVHRLVATAFCKKGPRQHDVDHIDGNKFNNKSSNLRWMTHVGNVRAFQRKRAKNG